MSVPSLSRKTARSNERVTSGRSQQPPCRGTHVVCPHAAHTRMIKWTLAQTARPAPGVANADVHRLLRSRAARGREPFAGRTKHPHDVRAEGSSEVERSRVVCHNGAAMDENTGQIGDVRPI